MVKREKDGLSEQILRLFPEQLRPKWKCMLQLEDRLLEIRLRVGQPVIFSLDRGEVYGDGQGNLVDEWEKAMPLAAGEMEQILRHICGYSYYAHEEELRKGFICTEGGFRVGVAGEVILTAEGNVQNIRYVSSLNIRIAREVKGVANPLLPWLYHGGRLYNTLLVSPPGCGKTTMLRDLIRLVSNGNAFGAGRTVGVVDERSELAGCYQGVPRNDVGSRTDVLDGCPKVEGMMMLLRSMAPSVIAVDELGGEADARALGQVLKCGCSVLATVHGESIGQLLKKPFMKALFTDAVFERILVLGKEKGAFTVEGIYGEDGGLLAAGL